MEMSKTQSTTNNNPLSGRNRGRSESNVPRVWKGNVKQKNVRAIALNIAGWGVRIDIFPFRLRLMAANANKWEAEFFMLCLGDI
jgi:hypothetical protein